MPTIHERLLAVAEPLSPTLARAIEANGPVRLNRPNGQESLSVRLCRAITGQQLSVAASRSIWARVVDAADERPLLDFLGEASTDALRTCGLSAAKARTLRAVAEAHAGGALEREILAGLDHSERTRVLTEIWGVGTWTADMIGMFYFCEPDIWPLGDVTANKTLTRLTSARRKTANTAARFAPYRTYLAMHMWRAADTVPD